jgi:hypothetical protein
MIETSSFLYEGPWKPGRKRRTLFGLYDPNNLIGLMQREEAIQPEAKRRSACGEDQ